MVGPTVVPSGDIVPEEEIRKREREMAPEPEPVEPPEPEKPPEPSKVQVAYDEWLETATEEEKRSPLAGQKFQEWFKGASEQEIEDWKRATSIPTDLGDIQAGVPAGVVFAEAVQKVREMPEAEAEAFVKDAPPRLKAAYAEIVAEREAAAAFVPTFAPTGDIVPEEEIRKREREMAPKPEPVEPPEPEVPPEPSKAQVAYDEWLETATEEEKRSPLAGQKFQEWFRGASEQEIEDWKRETGVPTDLGDIQAGVPAGVVFAEAVRKVRELPEAEAEAFVKDAPPQLKAAYAEIVAEREAAAAFVPTFAPTITIDFPEDMKPDKPGGTTHTLPSGQVVYVATSTMYKLGFRTPEEYRDAQRQGLKHGPHSGDLVPKDSILIFHRGKAYRYAKGSMSPMIAAYVKKKDYKVEVETHAGIRLYDIKVIEAYSKLEGETQFKRAMVLGIIPKGSEFIPGLSKEDIAGIEKGISETEMVGLPPVDLPDKTPRDWGYLAPKDVRAREEYLEEVKARAKARLSLSRGGYFEKGVVDVVRYLIENPEKGNVLVDYGYSEAQVSMIRGEADKLQRDNTKLPDGTWMAKEDMEEVKKQNPELHAILVSDGYGAYIKEYRERSDKEKAILADLRAKGFATPVGGALGGFEYNLMGAIVERYDSQNKYANLELVFGKDAVQQRLKLMMARGPTLSAPGTPPVMTQEEIAALVRPRGVSDKDWATLAPFVSLTAYKNWATESPFNIDVLGALQAGVKSDLIMKTTGMTEEEIEGMKYWVLLSGDKAKIEDFTPDVGMHYMKAWTDFETETLETQFKYLRNAGHTVPGVSWGVWKRKDRPRMEAAVLAAVQGLTDRERAEILLRYRPLPTGATKVAVELFYIWPGTFFRVLEPVLDAPREGVLYSGNYELWQKLKTRPKDDPERKAFVRWWQGEMLKAGAVVGTVAVGGIWGAVGKAGKFLTPAWLAKTPVLNVVPRAATSLAQIGFTGAPVLYTGATILEAVQSTDLQRKWVAFNMLPASEKDMYAKMAGYDRWKGLSTGGRANVLLHYAVPPGYSLREWSQTLMKWTEQLVETANKGSVWLQERAPAPIAPVVSIAGGAVLGVVEGMGYTAQIPLIVGSMAERIPSGTADEFAKEVAAGMAAFFLTVIPAAYKANPTLTAGRLVGLFLITPGTLAKLGRLGFARVGRGFVSERAMTNQIDTVTVELFRGTSKLTNKQAMALGDQIVLQLREGRPFAEVRIGKSVYRVKVRNVPYQRVMTHRGFHFTPDITKFKPGKGTGILYLSPQAARRAGLQSYTQNIPMKHPGIIEVLLPKKFDAKIGKLVAKGKKVELEIPIKDRIYEPIPGRAGKGVSANVEMGAYPIRRFTIKGTDVIPKGITARQWARLKIEVAKEATLDAVLGGHGRMNALKRAVSRDPKVKKIDAEIKKLRAQQPELVGKNGEIIRQRSPVAEPYGRGTMKSRVKGIVWSPGKDAVLLALDRSGKAYDLLGGSVDPKEILTPRGKWRHTGKVTWEEGFASQVKGEADLVVRDVRYIDMYMGKVHPHALSGCRIFESVAASRHFDTRLAWNKFQRYKFGYKTPELKDAVWWNGSKPIEVYPATFDILRALSKRYGFDMSKVRMYKGEPSLMKARDPGFARRYRAGRQVSEVKAEPWDAVYRKVKGKDHIVFDLDGTLVDAKGELLPGAKAFLVKLKGEGKSLSLWTHSTLTRARAILKKHGITDVFDRVVTREKYEPTGADVHAYKDIGTIKGDILVDNSLVQRGLHKQGKVIAPEWQYRYGKALSESVIAKMKQAEIKYLIKARNELVKGESWSFREWLKAENDLRTLAELIHGRRRVVEIIRDNVITKKEWAEIQKHPELISERAWKLLRKKKLGQKLTKQETELLYKEVERAFEAEKSKMQEAYDFAEEQAYRENIDFHGRRYMSLLETAVAKVGLAYRVIPRDDVTGAYVAGLRESRPEEYERIKAYVDIPRVQVKRLDLHRGRIYLETPERLITSARREDVFKEPVRELPRPEKRIVTTRIIPRPDIVPRKRIKLEDKRVRIREIPVTKEVVTKVVDKVVREPVVSEVRPRRIMRPGREDVFKEPVRELPRPEKRIVTTRIIPRPDIVPITKEVVTKVVDKVVREPVVSEVRPRRIMRPGREEEVIKRVRGSTGVMTWRQGTVIKDGKRVPNWWVLMPPYKTKADLELIHEVPPGATVVKGPRSAYRTIQTLTGSPPSREITIDMGIIDIIITRPTRRPGKKGAIRFKRDRRQRTVSQISVSGVR